MVARMKTGVMQANGTLAAEPTMDVQHVAQAILYITAAAGRERVVHDRDGNEDAAGGKGLSESKRYAVMPFPPRRALCSSFSRVRWQGWVTGLEAATFRSTVCRQNGDAENATANPTRSSDKNAGTIEQRLAPALTENLNSTSINCARMRVDEDLARVVGEWPSLP